MSSTGGSLCPDCRNEDWNNLVERPLDPDFTRIQPFNVFDNKHLYGRLVRTLTSQVKLESSNCPCCRFLSTINHGIQELNPHDSSLLMKRYALRRLEVTTLGSQMRLEPHRPDQASLALLRLGIQSKEDKKAYWQGRRYIALLGPGKNFKSLKIPHFIMNDFDWIQKAISHCKCSQHHVESDRKGPHNVAELLLIDCKASYPAKSTSDIVTLFGRTSWQYATLSYVWGPRGCVKDGAAAPVVNDAMRVTLELGLQYLWVDRHCIPQNDPKKKEEQIRNMNEVFSKSYITIMAAAGETAAYGLSGVSRGRIRRQEETQVKGCTLLELPSIMDTVRNSTWALRAWTLQEGLLSKRCLVFTDRGVLYHCRDLHIEEPLQRLVPNDTKVAMDSYESNNDWDIQGLFAIRESGGEEGAPRLKRRIAQYTQRQLSFPEDSLNAFLGVFTDFENNKKSKPQVYTRQNRPSDFTFPSHIWGVPIDYLVDDGVPVLEWYHPTLPLAKSRRDKFPSWSWSGWEGAIQFTKEHLAPRFISKMPECQPVSYHLPPNFSHETTCLYLTGPLVPLKFASQKHIDKVQKKKPANPDNQISHQHSVFELSPVTYSIIRSYMDTVLRPNDKTFGLLLFHGKVESQEMNRRALYLEGIIVLKENIVQKSGIRRFSRVGFLYSEDMWNCQLVNIKGASADTEIISESGSQAFGQQIVRQQICLV